MVKSNIPILSRKQPNNKNSKEIARTTISGEEPNWTKTSAKKEGTPDSAINLANNAVPITTIKMLAVLISAWRIPFESTCQFSLRLNPAIIIVRAAPIAPASVGVNAPRKIPSKTPKIMTGSGQVSRIASTISALVICSSIFGAKEGLSITRTMIIALNATAVRMPGRTPAAKSFATETSAKYPYSTIRIDGGINAPSVPAAAITPVASPGS